MLSSYTLWCDFCMRLRLCRKPLASRPRHFYITRKMIVPPSNTGPSVILSWVRKSGNDICLVPNLDVFQISKMMSMVRIFCTSNIVKWKLELAAKPKRLFMYGLVANFAASLKIPLLHPIDPRHHLNIFDLQKYGLRTQTGRFRNKNIVIQLERTIARPATP